MGRTESLLIITSLRGLKVLFKVISCRISTESFAFLIVVLLVKVLFAAVHFFQVCVNLLDEAKFVAQNNAE